VKRSVAVGDRSGSSVRWPRHGVVRAVVARDYRLARSYRVAFVLDIVLGVVNLAIFFFISRSLGDPSPASLGDAPSYFAFAAVGIAVTVVMEAASIGLATRLREEQLTGTLEALVAQPLTASELAFGVTAYPFLFATIRAGLYILAAALLLDLDVSEANWPAFVLMLVAIGIALTAIGVFMGALVLLVKRARALPGLVTLGLGLLGGAYFPISELPDWLQPIAEITPTRFAFDGLRSALFGGEGWPTDLLALAIFSATALPLGVWSLALALGISRRRGSLAQF
jgi:ABC-2 type transport system permease protein